ncbi:MAG TPA: FISUMP domain-containing protein, partial [Salinivirgaceae bacterium]|nr:FISUMP domain-containing protein [Salinivirgaceae bacterium]
TTHWNNPNTGATNETGFTALPGGCRYYYGYFIFIGEYGFWWSATEHDGTSAWTRRMHYNCSKVDRRNYHKELGFSVRCLRD